MNIRETAFNKFFSIKQINLSKMQNPWFDINLKNQLQINEQCYKKYLKTRNLTSKAINKFKKKKISIPGWFKKKKVYFKSKIA